MQLFTALVFTLAALCPTGPVRQQDDGTATTTERPRNVAIVVHEGVELLDFAGPGEVFEAAATQATGSKPAFRVYTVAPRPGPLVSQNFLTIQPEFTIADAPRPDILVIPGGRSRVLREDKAFMTWIANIVPKTEISMSVCTGAFVLGDAGFLDGKDVTTHRLAIAGLRAGFPKARVHENVRFVDQGALVTTAGVSAGIDGSLHVVGRLLGGAAAAATAEYMQYDWRPKPEDVASYDAQASEGDRDSDPATTRLLEARAALNDRRFEDALELWHTIYHEDGENAEEAEYALGLALHQLGRLDEALDAHLRCAKSETYRHRGLYNAACVHALQGRPDEAMEYLQNAVEAGMSDAEWLRSDTDLASLRERADFQKLVAKLK